jgi:hypothetical protein
VRLAAAALAAASRAKSKDLKVTDVQSGWFDAGIVNGENKLVPASVSAQNVSQEPIENVQINAVFRRGTERNRGATAHSSVGSTVWAAGATGRRARRAQSAGYTSLDHRPDVEAVTSRRRSTSCAPRLEDPGEDRGIPDRTPPAHRVNPRTSLKVRRSRSLS